VHEVVFSVDGQHLLSLGDGGKVIFWETNSGRRLLEQTFADRAPVQVGFSPTGTPVATVPKEKGGYEVEQLKAAGQAREGKEEGRQNEEGILDDLGSQLLARFSAGWAWPKRREAISPDGQRAITPIAGPCFAFLVIVPKNPQEAVAIAGDQFDAVQQGFTWDSRFAYAVIAEDLARGPGERSYSLAFWDAKTGKPAGRVYPPNGITAGIQWSPDGRHVLMMSDKRAWLWRDLSLPLK
jgi:WD40 repeat protein